MYSTTLAEEWNESNSESAINERSQSCFVSFFLFIELIAGGSQIYIQIGQEFQTFEQT